MLLALIWTVLLEAIASSVWSVVSLVWWHRHQGMPLGKLVSELYLAISGNIIFAAVIAGLFLLPPIIVQNPYLMNATRFDAQFFQAVFDVSSFKDISFYLSIILLAVPVLKKLIIDLRTKTYHTGNTRILQFERQNHTTMNTTPLAQLAVVFVISYAAYYFAFSISSVTLMLCIITAWRILSLWNPNSK